MALSLAGAAQGVRDLITEQSEAAVGFSIPMIAGMIPTIAEAFARTISSDPAKRDLLLPDLPFENTITAGTCDLTANLSTDKLLLDSWETWEIRLVSDPAFPPFHMVKERGQLNLKRPTDSMYISAAIQGADLWTRNVDGALDADLGDITIMGPAIPTVAENSANTTLRESLVGDFTLFGARFLLGNVAKTRNGKG